MFSTIHSGRRTKRVPRKVPLGGYGDGEAVIASPREYKRRLTVMVENQLGRCGTCLRPFTHDLTPTFGHAVSRCAGKRDDRVCMEDGSQRNAAQCMDCNGKQGSRRAKWLDNRFIPAVYASVIDWQRAEPL